MDDNGNKVRTGSRTQMHGEGRDKGYGAGLEAFVNKRVSGREEQELISLTC